MFNYLKGVKKEIKKTVFPTTEEVKRNTLIVIAFCSVISLVMWGITTTILEGLKVIL